MCLVLVFRLSHPFFGKNTIVLHGWLRLLQALILTLTPNAGWFNCYIPSSLGFLQLYLQPAARVYWTKVAMVAQMIFNPHSLCLCEHWPQFCNITYKTMPAMRMLQTLLWNSGMPCSNWQPMRNAAKCERSWRICSSRLERWLLWK